jgi:hypothetical protein
MILTAQILRRLPSRTKDEDSIVGASFITVKLGLGLLLCTIFSVGQARTLFIDFNNAESEIQVFKEKVGGKSGEVVVLPSYKSITKKQRAAARTANAAIEMHTARAQECATTRKPRVDRCDEVYIDIRQAELERLKATSDYSASDLKAELRALAADSRDKKFDLLVVSGHHETGYYRGELTQANEHELGTLLIDSGIDRSQFNTIVLLGCGTGTKEAYIQYLAPLFTDVALIFGAEDSAPTRDESRNLMFIRKLISVRPDLLKAKTTKEVEPIYRRLLNENWPVSLLWRSKHIFSAQRIEKL